MYSKILITLDKSSATIGQESKIISVINLITELPTIHSAEKISTISFVSFVHATSSIPGAIIVNSSSDVLKIFSKYFTLVNLEAISFINEFRTLFV